MTGGLTRRSALGKGTPAADHENINNFNMKAGVMKAQKCVGHH
jgi:hypothetical protein